MATLFLAAVAVGDATLADIESWNPVAETIEPIAENRALYDRHLALFKRLYGQTRDLMAEIGGD